MNIKGLLIVISISVAQIAQGQTDILSTSSDGFLSRGVLMYNDKNYVGAIDQLSHIKVMPASESIKEEAAFYIAMSKYERGKVEGIAALKTFISEYSASSHIPEAWFNIGNYYFYNGEYQEAMNNYSNIGTADLNTAQGEDFIYRRAYSKLRIGDLDNAKKDFNRLANSRKYSDASTLYNGYILYANGDYDNAMNKFTSITKKGDIWNSSRYYMTQIYFHNSDFSKGSALGRSLLLEKTNEDFIPELNRIVGESSYFLGNDEDANKYLTNYISACGENVAPQRSSLYILGLINYRNGNYDEVVKHISQVTGEDDALAQSAYLYVGQSYLKQNKLNAASIAFEKAFNMNYDSDVQETAFYNYAIAQNGGGRTPFNKSIDIFEQFLNKYPHSKYASDVEDYMITAYVSGNDYNRALESINHIKAPSTKVLKAKQVVLYNLGVQALSNENTTEALSLLTEARNLGNLDKTIANECYLWIGECQYRKGNFAAAEKSQQAFIQGANPASKNYALGNYNLGYSNFQQRSYTAARSAFEKALDNQATLNANIQADAYNRIGDCHYYAKQYAQAETNYNKAFSLNSSAGDYSLFQKAMMNGLQKQHSAKIKQIDELLSDFPSSPLAPNAMLEKAQALIAMNKNDDASATLERLEVKYPETTEARKGLLQLAITEKNIDNESKAISAYKKVVSKYPSSEEAALAIEDLRTIYADNNNLKELANFVNGIENAPKIDVSEIDKLTFDAAERAYVAEKQEVNKMKSYIKNYPNGAYITNAQYYMAKYDFHKGNYDNALNALNKVLEKGHDASFAEDAIAMKSDILMKQGHTTDALISYKELSKKATTSDNRTIAELGVMRSALELGRYGDVVTSANALMKSSVISAEEEKEARYSRAIAYSNMKRTNDAETDWLKLAKDTRNIYGAQSAYHLAELYFNAGNMKEAERTLNNFIDEGTPHQYWLARGFILLSDIYKKKGDNFEAREYLETLKSNYPGKESDIFIMINDRLKTLKK
ncbi:MAG: tetratricopeptide repeat protein [Muribaculaceae bacterium]